MVLECKNCSAIVDAQVLAHYIVSDDIAPSMRYSFAKCPKCDDPLLAVEVEGFDDWEPPERIYPATDLALSGTIPKPIAASFDEAARCLRAKAFTAAAIMCRKTLEGICVAQGAIERNLAKALEKLRDDGVIDRRLFEWAEQLRLFGNEAAHDVHVTIAAPDASDIVDFTRALIEYVFTFQERFEDFKARRSAARAAV